LLNLLRRSPYGEGTASHRAANPSQSRHPRRGHGWKLFVAWFIVPAVLLGGAELALRRAGFGVSMQLFVPRTVDGKTVCVTNSAFYQQFYIEPFRGIPVEFSMPAAKPPGTCRVFVFGSSEARGAPVPEFSFWGILGTLLRAGGHASNVEIYCLAMPGADSHIMRAAAKACAHYQPDLFLFYMGNGELNPSLAQAMVWDLLPPRLSLSLLHLNIALNESRLVQLLHGIRGPADLSRPHGKPKGIRDSERAYRYFQANVDDICGFAKTAGAQVILCTVGSRLREWMPDGTHAEELETEKARLWDDAFMAGNTLREQGQFQDALSAYERAAAIDGSHAGLAYAMACCRYSLGEYAGARNDFVRARELDNRHCRAGNRINEILRETATARAGDGVHLSDTAQALATASPHGIEGPELFLDHAHPRFEGNHILAQTVLTAMKQVVPSLAAQTPELSVEECRARQAMTEPDLRDQLTMTLQWFQMVPNQRKEPLEQEMAALDARIGNRSMELRLDACRRALDIDPGNHFVRTRYMELLVENKDTVNGLAQARELASELPYSWHVHRVLAELLAEGGDSNGAMEALRRALALRPDDGDAWLQLGRLLRGDKQPEAALRAFRDAFRLRPGAQPQCEIAEILRDKGDLSGAVAAYRRALGLEPRNPAAFEGLVLSLCESDRLGEATAEMLHWCKSSSDGKNGLSSLEKTVETRTSVLQVLAGLLPQDPNTSCRFQDRLTREGSRLESLGDLPGAKEAYRTAIPLNPQDNRPVRSLEKLLSGSSPVERRRVWEETYKENPGIALVATFCGVARADAGDIKGAESAFASARLLAPGEWHNDVLAGDALAAAGVWQDAVVCYERALALNPGLDYIRDRLNTAKNKTGSR